MIELPQPPGTRDLGGCGLLSGVGFAAVVFPGPGRIAQLARASGLHPEGRGFDSLFAHRRCVSDADAREALVIDDVTFDDSSVRRVTPEGGVVEVRWDDLAEVRVETIAGGPFVEDMYWKIVDASGVEVTVTGESMTDDLLARLQALPGFDHEEMIVAMGSTQEARFVLWRERS